MKKYLLARVLQSLLVVAVSAFCPVLSHAQSRLLFPASEVDAMRPALPQSSREQFESLITSSGYEDVGTFSQNNRYRKIGRSVGRLKIFAEDGRFSTCTAWLVGTNHLLTNYHCIDPTDFPNGRIARVRIEMGVLSTVSRFDVYQVNMPPVESSREFDYAVLQVDPRAAQKYGFFSLSARDAVDSEELFIIHHPLGQPQSLSRFECRAAAPAVDGKSIHHLCNTQPGSSGSPIVSDNDQKLLGLHHAGVPVRAGQPRTNTGIRLAAILARSSVLRSDNPAVAFVSPPVPVPAPAAWNAPAVGEEVIEVCPAKLSNNIYYSISVDRVSGSGWYQADRCRSFTVPNSGGVSKVFIYGVSYWGGDYGAIYSPPGPHADIAVCGSVAPNSDLALGLVFLEEIGNFNSRQNCRYSNVVVPFAEINVGGSNLNWRVRRMVD